MDIKSFYRQVIDFREPVKIYATLDPDTLPSPLVTLSNGDLSVSINRSYFSAASCNIPKSSGKWYYEFLYKDGQAEGSLAGFGLFNANDPDVNDGTTPPVHYFHYYSWTSRGLVVDGVAQSVTNLDSIKPNAKVMIAVDMDAGKVFIGHNGNWMRTPAGLTGNPSAGTDPLITFTASEWGEFCPWVGERPGCNHTVNFGQNTFSYSVPTGYNAGIYNEFS